MASPNDLISIKLQLANENRRLKLPLRELAPSILPHKLRQFLAIPDAKTVVFERYSDSAGNYVLLDPQNPAVYKQLYRAAKAKTKLRIKVTISEPNEPVASLSTGQVNASEVTLAPTVMPIHPSSQIPNELPTNDFSKSAETLVPTEKKTTIGTPINSQAQAAAEKIDEAPVPKPFALKDQFYEDLANVAKLRATTLRAKEQSFQVPLTSFTVQCNYCSMSIPNAHWHCNVCDGGDFDLCMTCVESGIHCDVDSHYLIKRTIENGKVKYSTSSIVDKKPLKPEPKVEETKEMPGAFKGDVKEEVLRDQPILTRTCNCCVNEYEESNFVTCHDCEDYDLCIPCHYSLKHGHHPNHTFAPVSQEVHLDLEGSVLCAPGRNLRHFATCDGCDKDIYGVRHKCLNCPDWDYCTTCVKSARHIHPGHRFVPIYEHITGPACRLVTHCHIRCDGPLCKDKTTYIRGDRYKCAVCHDTDFCANCEALPTNPHNRTHPLIKFRTPVRNVSVTTFGEKENGEAMKAMGDQMPQTSSKSTETTPARSANAATQVQTVAETKPVINVPAAVVKKAEPKNMEEVSEKIKQESPVAPALAPSKEVKVERSPSPAPPTFDAHFVHDTIVDGSKLPAESLVHQVWVLRNPGPLVWPAGCSVKYIGGDNMLNIDSEHPASTSDLDKATQSSVIPRAVAVGEEVSFSVTLKTPKRLGKAISYWRLKTADGIPFGHKLWCDIDVVERQGEPEKKVQQSQMIFPTLEKESPVSSTVVTEAPETASSVTSKEREFDEELESLGLDDDETDDGFLTDEEYEMLDSESAEEAINGRK